ncbi:MAG: head maturation protease, ClpP-related [Thomasclavelia ramosa]
MVTQIKKYNFKNENNNIVGSLELENNKLYIYGDILMDSLFKFEEETEDVCPKDILDFLKGLENQEEIEIHINSGGGSVFGGLAIYNLLKSYKGKKIVYIDGLAGSIASVIALVGDVLYIYKNSMMMIHNPLTAMCGYYNAKNLQEQIEALEKCKKSILNVYMANINMAKIIHEEEISQLMDNETWLVGEEITEYFKGYILQDKNEIVACTSSYFDSYKNTPKNIKNIENKPINNSLEEEKQKILNDLEKISIF